MSPSEPGGVVLVDAPLVPDPDAGHELSPDDPRTLSDADVHGSRLLVVCQSAKGAELASGTYGVVRIACTFHAAPGARFTWGRIVLRLEAPSGVRVLDLAPREGRDAAGHCSVKGSGESTQLARWDFTENPQRQAGISHEEVVTLTLPVIGQVSGTLTASAHLVRPGLAGGLERFRDLVLRTEPYERRYPFSFEITVDSRADDDARFLNMD